MFWPFGSTSKTPVHQAAAKGRLTRLQYIIEHDPALLYATDACGWTLLQVAASTGQLDVARYLIEAGLDVNGHDAHHQRTLMHAMELAYGDERLLTRLEYADNHSTPKQFAIHLMKNLMGDPTTLTLTQKEVSGFLPAHHLSDGVDDAGN